MHDLYLVWCVFFYFEWEIYGCVDKWMYRWIFITKRILSFVFQFNTLLLHALDELTQMGEYQHFVLIESAIASVWPLEFLKATTEKLLNLDYIPMNVTCQMRGLDFILTLGKPSQTLILHVHTLFSKCQAQKERITNTSL